MRFVTPLVDRSSQYRVAYLVVERRFRAERPRWAFWRDPWLRWHEVVSFRERHERKARDNCAESLQRADPACQVRRVDYSRYRSRYTARDAWNQSN